MLQGSTIQFLQDLKVNNNKNWFEEHRTNIESAKDDFSLFVEAIIKEVSKFDEPIGLLKPKDCTFRINRDIRFSQNKTPYKTNMAASFSHGGKKAMIAGYYFHCEPNLSFAAGGFYMPLPPELAKIRQEIDYSFNEWIKIIKHKKFKSLFDKGVEGTDMLKRPPKGYDEENPAINFLKMKGFVVSHAFTNTALQDKKAIKQIATCFEVMKPMIDFLNRAVE